MPGTRGLPKDVAHRDRQRPSDSSNSSTSTHSTSSATVKPEPQSPQEEFQIALRNGTASASFQSRQRLRGTSVIRLPMLGLMTCYYVAQGDALNQAELYHQISSIIDPGPIFDSAISAAALTRCGQADHKQGLVYQVRISTDPYLSPWISHTDGVAQIIRLRGPERYQTSLGHRIFLHYRTSAALQALMSRKSSFLSSPEWLMIPSSLRPKTPSISFST
ncbi:hypothetical protein BDZ45DRAFT_699774 [Acephala macrosclerotiorum]|nr:hypothetical protein BDZ45DRAFT_699774 [Acephala macrosclerotiorum]